MTAEPYAFLSYSRQDSPTVDRLADSLASVGIKIWRDIDDIEPGTDWMHAIKQAIMGARAVIFIASRNSARSRFILEKLSSYLANRNALIPILIDDLPITELPRFVSKFQLQLLKDGFERTIDAVTSRLQALGFSITPPTPIVHERANKGYVFLSYAKEDLHYTANVTQFFKQRGYAYFDYKDSPRRHEADFDEELEERLQSAQLVTSIITPHWKKAVWPKKEYLFATKIGVPTYLLMFEDPGPSILIIDRTPIDFTDNREGAFSVLDQELKRRRL